MLRHVLRTGALAAACVATLAPARADQTHFRSEVVAGAVVRVGVHAAAKKDCTPAPLPTISVVSPPKHGVLQIRTGKVKSDQIKACPGIELPANLVFYRSQPGFTGEDKITYEVKNAGSRTQSITITVTVKPGPTPPGTPPKKPSEKEASSGTITRPAG
ncbi:MAG TPA: hypothetical protein VFV47_13445 [Hyphomicrobiaceae bacterium]|nr:hypothetical protein [Hyphomicrobiaceae bacterium]